MAGEAVAAEGVAARGQHLKVAPRDVAVADQAEVRPTTELRRAPLLVELLETPRLHLSLDQKNAMQTQGLLMVLKMLMKINCSCETGNKTHLIVIA